MWDVRLENENLRNHKTIEISEFWPEHSPIELLGDEHAVVVVEVLVIKLRPKRQGAGSQGLPGELPGARGREGEVMLVLVIMISLAESVFVQSVDLFLSAIIFLWVRMPGIAKIFSRWLWPKLRNKCRMNILIFHWSQMLSAVIGTSECINRVFTRIGKIVHTRFRSSFFDSF